MTLFQALKLRRAHNVFFSVFTSVYPFNMLSNFSMVSPLPNCLMLTSFPFLSLRRFLDILQADQKRNWNGHHSFYHLHPHTNQNRPYLERRLSHPCNQKIAFLHGAATHNKVHYVLLLATYLKLKKKIDNACRLIMTSHSNDQSSVSNITCPPVREIYSIHPLWLCSNYNLLLVYRMTIIYASVYMFSSPSPAPSICIQSATAM